MKLLQILQLMALCESLHSNEANDFRGSYQVQTISDLPSYEAYMLGVDSFEWSRDLSSNAKSLYDLILLEVCWKSGLPEYAETLQIDLCAGLAELREYQLIDESHPEFISIVRRNPH